MVLASNTGILLLLENLHEAIIRIHTTSSSTVAPTGDDRVPGRDRVTIGLSPGGVAVVVVVVVAGADRTPMSVDTFEALALLVAMMRTVAGGECIRMNSIVKWVATEGGTIVMEAMITATSTRTRGVIRERKHAL